MIKINMKEILKEAKIIKFEKGVASSVYLVEHNNEKYVLRQFKTKKDADFYIGIIKRLKKFEFFPQVINNQGKKVLFEYISGRDCKESDSIKVAKQIGLICACINNLRTNKKYELDSRFKKFIKQLEKSKIFSKDESKKAIELYSSLKKEVKPKIVLDANDVYADNFRINKGKIYFIDIEAIKPILKGQGIMKGFNKWFKTKKAQNEFLKGYNSTGNSNFLTEDYIRFANLFFYVRQIAIRDMFKEKQDRKNVEKLKRLLN